MQQLFASFSLLLVALLVGSSPVLRASSLYSMQALAALGNQASGVSALNNAGVAVGFYTDATGVQNPALFNGSRTQLGTNGAAYGINDSGTVVGVTYSGNSPGVTQWSGNTQTALGITGYGMAINDGGKIVGGFQTAGQTHAFSYSNGSVQDLGTLGGTWSTAYAVNNSGQIAGTSTLANGHFTGFVSNGNSLVSLGTLGGANSYAQAISQNGFVAGSSQNAAGYLNAFLWTSAGMQNLGTLGGSISTGEGVNDLGWTVGSSTTASGASDGFLYRNGAMTDLNSFLPVGTGWTITGASGINDAGQILATATEDGQTWAVDLNPTTPSQTSGAVIATPEPRALWLAAFGMLILGLNIARRRSPKYGYL